MSETTKTYDINDINDIKRANESAGQEFFSPGAMKFFASRVCPTVHQGPGGIYFVTSEQYKGSVTLPRKYTVRKFDPDTGRVSSASALQAYSDRKAAQNAAGQLAATEHCMGDKPTCSECNGQGRAPMFGECNHE
jgi:hypothetical protein